MKYLRLEEYNDVLKVILMPSANFSSGYFYTDNTLLARELINECTWALYKQGDNIYVHGYLNKKVVSFHREYIKRLYNYYPEAIDHIDRVGIDNRKTNLNLVTTQQNIRNRPSRGYIYNENFGTFRVQCCLNNKIQSGGIYKSEVDAILASYYLREKLFFDYNYNFYLDRHNDLDILDIELIGKLTNELATYYHIKRYVESNPWYVYRYNLFDYCKINNISTLSYFIDSQGFMIDNQGSKFCPY